MSLPSLIVAHVYFPQAIFAKIIDIEKLFAITAKICVNYCRVTINNNSTGDTRDGSHDNIRNVFLDWWREDAPGCICEMLTVARMDHRGFGAGLMFVDP